MIKLFVDGSATPNPGLGGIGFVLYDDDKQIMHGYTFLGENITNNQAEFLAVVHSLFHVINVFQPKELEINTDSEIVHSVFLGKKQLRSDKLVDIFKAGLQATSLIPKIHWIKISRLINGYADSLAKRAVYTKKSEVFLNVDKIPKNEEKDR